MKKVAVYVRVSTTQQEAQNQITQLKKYCEISNYQIYKEYVDIISGKEDSRPEYDKLFDDAHKKLFDMILFWDLSRFSRSGTLFTLQKLKELEHLGITWHSYQEPYVNSDNELTKNVIIAVLSSIAKIEREKISQRTKAGLATARAKGKRLGRPPIPEKVIKEVLQYLKEGKLSYSQISERVIYKIKFGKEKHISPAQISQIKKNHLEKGSPK